MTDSDAAKIRIAIYLTGSLLGLGLAFGPVGLLIAAVLLLGLSYWEYDRAKFARLVEAEKRDHSGETP